MRVDNAATWGWLIGETQDVRLKTRQCCSHSQSPHGYASGLIELDDGELGLGNLYDGDHLH
jgi:hypothetical protein